MIVRPSQSVQSLGSPNNLALNEQSLISPLSDTGSLIHFKVTCSDSDSMGQGDWFRTNLPGVGLSNSFWFDIDNDGTLPIAPGFAADGFDMVSITSGLTAAQVADALVAQALTGNNYSWSSHFDIFDNGDGTVDFISKVANVLDYSSTYGDATTDGQGSVVIEDLNLGSQSNYVQTYSFIFDTEDNQYYLWTNPGGASTDPSPDPEYIGIEIAFPVGASSATIANSLSQAINARPEFESNLFGTDQVLVRGALPGNTEDAVDNIENPGNDTEWDFSLVRDGTLDPEQNILPDPGGSPFVLDNDP